MPNKGQTSRRSNASWGGLPLARIIVGALLVLVAAALAPAVADSREQASGQTTSVPTENPRPGPDVLYWPPATSPQLENTGVWEAEPILVSGASAYRDGEFLYQDYLYDDIGADSSPVPAGGPLGPFSPAGHYTYPTNPAYADNAADLLEVRLKPLADATAVRISYNTMLDPELVATTIALGDSADALPLPHGANARMPGEVFVTVHGATADVVDATTGEPVADGQPTVTVDVERRQVEVRVPYEAFDPRGQSSVRVAAAAGLWDLANGQYLIPQEEADESNPGGAGTLQNPPAFFNVAFRYNEPDCAISGGSCNFTANERRESQQAEVLGTGDLSPFFASVDFTKLQAAIDDDMPGQVGGVPQTGYIDRILVSHFEGAQGHGGTASSLRPEQCTDPDDPCVPDWSGRLQPYEIYVPTTAPPPSGYRLVVGLHGGASTYAMNVGSRHPAQLATLGAPAIYLSPAGRGISYWWYGQAGADVFEAIADLGTRYNLDPDRWTVTGPSHGGYGTYKLAGQFPDLFAAAGPIVPCQRAGALSSPGPEDPSSVHHLLPSFRNVPLMQWNSDGDALCPYALPGGQRDMLSQLSALGYRYDFWTMTNTEHVTLSYNDQLEPMAYFLAGHTVMRNPHHVTYVFNEEMNQPEVGLNADHAYWLSGLELRDADVTPPVGTIDVFSHGFGLGDAPIMPEEVGAGVLTGGWVPAIAYTTESRGWGPAPPAPIKNELDIVANNISRVTIDPARARINCDATVNIDSDGPIEVVLAGCPGSMSSSPEEPEGASAPNTTDDSSTVAAGPAPDTDSDSDRDLPATGGSVLLTWISLAGLALAAKLVRR